MRRYRVAFAVEAHTIEGAALTARALLVGQRDIFVAEVPEIACDRRWSVRVAGERGTDATVVFDGGTERGLVLVTEPLGVGLGASVRPGELAKLVRGMQSFPLDLLDAMADRDQRERARRGGGA